LLQIIEYLKTLEDDEEVAGGKPEISRAGEEAEGAQP
jgi:hypothetical protein